MVAHFQIQHYFLHVFLFLICVLPTVTSQIVLLLSLSTFFPHSLLAKKQKLHMLSLTYIHCSILHVQSMKPTISRGNLAVMPLMP